MPPSFRCRPLGPNHDTNNRPQRQRQALSDALDRDMPPLPDEEEEEDKGGGVGLAVWDGKRTGPRLEAPLCEPACGGVRSF